jgi:hypothetical protein
VEKERKKCGVRSETVFCGYENEHTDITCEAQKKKEVCEKVYFKTTDKLHSIPTKKFAKYILQCVGMCVSMW